MTNHKLFHLCSHFYPATSIGGPIYCGIELLINLDKIASQEIFAYTSLIDQKKWTIDYNKSSRFATNSVISFTKHNLLSYFFLSFALISSIFNKRCIFVHGTYNPQYVFALLFLRLFNYKCFIIPHGTLDYNRRISSRSFLIRRLSRSYIKHILYSNYIIFSNLAEYEAVNITQRRPHQSYYISNFVPFTDESVWIKLLYPLLKAKNTTKFSNNIEHLDSIDLENKISAHLDTFSSNSLKHKRMSLFFFGRLSPEKGVELIIPTLSRLYCEGYISGFVILGGTDDSSYERYIRSLFSAHKLPVFISGFIARPNAHRLLKKFKPSLIFPSVSDNFNLCLHESLNLGLVSFVSTRINSVDDTHHPLVRPFDLEDVSTQLYQSVIDHFYHISGNMSDFSPKNSESETILNSYRDLLATYLQ